tara:strand:+ start:812 stop:2197 length:1386 start_codon:yes stop_codon:yes gene_type:complete
MKLTSKILKDKDFFIKLTLVFCFSISWLSISSNFQNLLIINPNEKITITQLINFIRTALNICIFPLLVYLFVKMLTEINDFRFRNNLFYLLPLGYFLSQIPGLFYTSNSLENFLYILSSINIIIIMTLVVRVFKANEILILIYITFTILFFVLMSTFLKDLVDFIFSRDIGKKFYGSVNTIIGENYIRSSGASRISLVLLIIYSTTLMKHISSQFFKTIPLFLFSTIIFLYESRAVVALLIVFIISNFLVNQKFFLENIKKYLLFCMLFPFLLSIQINYLHSPDTKRVADVELSKEGAALKKLIPRKTFDFLCKISKCNDETQRLLNKDRMLTSSGRVNDWNTLIKKFNLKEKNLIFGYGSQADRFLINQTASNGILYALTSAGIIGLLFYLIFSFLAFLHILKFFFKNKNRNPISYFSIFILIIIGVRSIIESSYALFSIDFILFYMGYALAEKYNRILK